MVYFLCRQIPLLGFAWCFVFTVNLSKNLKMCCKKNTNSFIIGLNSIAGGSDFVHRLLFANHWWLNSKWRMSASICWQKTFTVVYYSNNLMNMWFIRLKADLQLVSWILLFDVRDLRDEYKRHMFLLVVLKCFFNVWPKCFWIHHTFMFWKFFMLHFWLTRLHTTIPMRLCFCCRAEEASQSFGE